MVLKMPRVAVTHEIPNSIHEITLLDITFIVIPAWKIWHNNDLGQLSWLKFYQYLWSYVLVYDKKPIINSIILTLYNPLYIHCNFHPSSGMLLDLSARCLVLLGNPHLTRRAQKLHLFPFVYLFVKVSTLSNSIFISISSFDSGNHHGWIWFFFHQLLIDIFSKRSR